MDDQSPEDSFKDDRSDDEIPNGKEKELAIFKEKVKLLEDEIDKLNLTKEQIDRLNRRQEEAEKENLTEEQVVKKVLTKEQRSRVKLIKNELHKLHHEKKRLSREIQKESTNLIKGYPSKSQHKPKRHSKVRGAKASRPKQQNGNLNLSKEQLTTIKALNKHIANLDSTKWRLLETYGVDRETSELSVEKMGELKLNKSEVEKLSLIKELIGDLKLTKREILKNQISGEQINKLNVLIQNISKIEITGPCAKPKKGYDEKVEEEIIYYSDEGKKKKREPKTLDKINKYEKLRIRHANCEDVPEILNMCNKHTEAMFNVSNIENLIGSSWLSVVAINIEDRIVAFMVLNDYPNVPYLPRVGWESWILHMYLTNEFMPPNTRFLHFLAWNDEVKDDFLQKLMPKVFAHDPFVNYVLFFLPPGQIICPPYSTIFEQYLERRNLENELRSVKKARLNLQRFTLGLYVAHRDRFGPNIAIRKTHKIHNESVIKNLRIMAPFLLKVFGKKFYKSLVSKRKNQRYKRLTITGECFRGGKKGIGIMTVTKSIDTKLMEEYYDTFSYHGFRKMNKKDTWYKIFLRKQGIEETNVLKPDTQLFPMHFSNEKGYVMRENCKTSINALQCVEREMKNAISCKKTMNEKNLYHKIKLEEEALNYEHSKLDNSFEKCTAMNEEGKFMDMDLRLARPTGIPFTPEELQEIQMQKHNKNKLLKISSASSINIQELKQFIDDQISSVKNRTPNGKTVNESINNIDNNEEKNHDLTEDKVYECSYRNMYKALWEINGKKKIMRPTTETQVDYYGKNTAMAVELFVPSYNEHPSCCLYYLRTAFEEYRGRDYCLVTAPPHQEEQPLLQYFQKVPSRNKTFGFRDLYVCHKLAIIGTHSVREGLMKDFEEIMAMSYRQLHSREMHLDVLSILVEESSSPSYLETDPDCPLSNFDGNFRYYGSETKCYVFMAGSLLVGYAVVEPNYDMEFYFSHYKMEKFVPPGCHKVDGQGFVRHMVIAPLFRHLTRFFLRGIMKFCDWTTLVASFLPQRLHEMYPQFSLIQGLEQWIQIGPRILPQYWKIGLGTRTPGWGNAWEHKARPPRALHLMTYRSSGTRKKLLTCKIVVVGVGDTALSFLEHLIFSPSNEYIGFRYITVISERGLPLKYPDGFEKAVKTMIPDTSGRYDQEYLDKMVLETWVTSVYGIITFIDRENNLIHMNNKMKIQYDYLFLFCGCQFLQPIGNLEVKNKPVIVDNAYEAVKRARELPENLFIINNHIDAYKALNDLATCFMLLGNVEGSQVVVYGNCVEAFACVTALLEFGVSGERITIVTNPGELCRSTMYIRCPEVKEAVIQTLEELNVTVYQGYRLRLKWKETLVFNKRYIEAIKFGSTTNKIVVNAIALFSYFPRSISHRSYLICQSAGLAYNKQLIIDTNFLTSADDIYAGGPFTRYSSSVKTEAFNHEFYNSVEIGAEIAKTFIERKLSENKTCKDSRKNKDMILFSFPLIMNAKLPGGWNYLRITSPGIEDVLCSSNAVRSKLLQTGNPKDKDGPGFFQIMIDEHGLVNDITCYSTSAIDAKNLIHVYGKHECLLNNLIYKFKGDQIADFFAYFREPWAYAIYHDKFPLLMQSIDMLFLEKLPYEEASFFDVVAYALEVKLWEKISESDKKLLEDLFNNFPNLKSAIDAKVESFLERNQNTLTTYLTQQRLEKYQEEMKSSRVADHFSAESYMKPLFDHPPKHIIPEIRRRREMDDRPIEMKESIMELGSEKFDSEEASDKEILDANRLKRNISKKKSKASDKDSSIFKDSIEEQFMCDEYSDSTSIKPASLKNPYISGIDLDEEVEITVQPTKNRNIDFFSMPVEEIEFEEAIRKKVNEFEKKTVEELKKKYRND